MAIRSSLQIVIPWAFSPRICSVAKAGIHPSASETVEEWIPAFAGMTYYAGKAKQNLKAWP